LLYEAKIPQTGLSITVHRSNFNEIIGGLPLFVSRYGIRQVYFSRYFHCSSSKLEELTPEQQILLSDKCEEWRSGTDQEFPTFEAVILGKTCTCGRSSVVVTPGGELKACPFVDFRETRMSNDRSLIDIWKQSEHFWQIRDSPRSSCAARNLRDDGKIEGK
jgi:MoaA/NifB/PqqE/SkfB family radical SAM enzyme